MKFSANLGFLWSELALPDAIRAAHRAGFDAVECHWPYETPALDVAQALQETGLEMLGLNTCRGRAGENGLTAVPGREEDALAAVDEALNYAQVLGCKSVHVMAGFASGPEAEAVFVSTLHVACERAARLGVTLLIEPLNHYDAPGYFLRTVEQATEIILNVGQPNLKLMFDFYHVQIEGGDVSRRFTAALPLIGHVQIAAVPDRQAPDHGELNYQHIYSVIARAGWTRPIGAEYRPMGATEPTLAWLSQARGAAS